MTIPVPVPTDPIADAALHIRDFALATDARLTGAKKVVAFDTGVQTSNGDGSITAGTIAGITSIAGVVCGPVYVYQDQPSVLWVPVPVRDPNQPRDLWCRCFNAPTNTVNVGKQQRVCGLAWGPIAGRDILTPTPRAPGDLFARGVTAKGIPYPGTDEPQYRTAAAISDMADAIGPLLSAGPTGVNVAMRANVWTTDSVGWFGANMAPDLSLVRGAVAIAWDTSGAYTEARIFAWEPRGYTGGSTGSTAGFYAHSNDAEGAAPNNYPRRVRSAGVGAVVIAWGDK